VLEKQLVGAMSLDIEVRVSCFVQFPPCSFECYFQRGKQKVYLVGGFEASPLLRSYLRRYLVEFVRDRKLKYEIDLYLTKEQDW